MIMKALEWTDDLSGGVHEIDDDHKKIIKYYNELFAACLASMGPDVVLNTLEALIESSKGHFRREEDSMEKEGYSGLAEQRREHQDFIRKVEDIKKRAKSDPDHEFSNEVLGFIDFWIRNHILGLDLALARYIHAKH